MSEIAQETRNKRILEAKKRLSDAQKELKAHIAECPGDHFWAYGCSIREKARQSWILKKERLEGHVKMASSMLETAKSLWIVGWSPAECYQPMHYDASRSSRIKDRAA